MERVTGFLLCLAFVLCVQMEETEGFKVIRVLPKSDADVSFLKNLENRQIQIDFWTEPNHPGHSVDMHLSDEDYITVIGLLNEQGMSSEILIGDVQKLVDSQKMRSRSRSGSFHTDYHTLDEIHDKLSSFSKEASHVKVFSIGKSYEGRSQLAVQIKGAPKPDKPIFFLQCGIHAREWVAPASCMYIAHQMTANYGYDSSVTALLDKMDFIILPVVNVDGYAYTWEKDRFWRKTRSPNPGYKCMGTDPNRNWDHWWGYTGASKRPCAQTYRGKKPFSEMETRNVKNFLTSLGSRVKGFIDTHAYSQMWFTPWGYTATDTEDHKEQMRVAKAAVDALYNAGYGTRYKYGSSAALLYAAAGGSEDWTYGKLGIKYSFGTELRDTGRYGFLLPAHLIIPTAREYFEGLKALVAAMKV